MSKLNDSLFLLEVLIDKIVFVKSPCFSDKDFRTCVQIECPAVEPLEICDDEPGACVAKSGGPYVKTFNNGKSCLFSLKESDISAAMSKFPIKVTVVKSLPCGCLPTKIIMGECIIDMTKEFVDVRNRYLEDPSNISYQALKDSFQIKGLDGKETGNIVMFLRISCFGKLIVTRFQGSSAPTIGSGRGSSSIVDRSCTPRKNYQSAQDPCACGAALGHGSGSGGTSVRGPCTGGGHGVCPTAGDPYNKLPCEEQDDPCYCAGPKPEPKPPMKCRNTDQYCLHLPKGSLLSLPTYREVMDEQNNIYKLKKNKKDQLVGCSKIASTKDMLLHSLYQENINVNLSDNFFSQDFIPRRTLYTKPERSQDGVSFTKHSNCTSRSPMYSLNPSKMQSKVDYPFETQNIKSVFDLKESVICMTLFENYCRHTSGTQATALVNKCFQVHSNTNINKNPVSLVSSKSDFCSTCTMSTLCHEDSSRPTENMHCSEVYFFCRRKNKQVGMGLQTSTSSCKHGQKSKCDKNNSTTTNSKTSTTSSKTSKDSNKSNICTSTAYNKPKNGTKRRCLRKSAKSPTKSVSIKVNNNNKQPCPAIGATKGDMMITIAHIKIGAKGLCPTHGNEPCQGPKCKSAAADMIQGPVKVTTVNNARRGVFELVVRRMTGAPLARNELMLEWTPPPTRPPCGPPCLSPCLLACTPPGPCRPSKCKIVVCQHSPSCKTPRCYKRPCGPLNLSCSLCRRCCKLPCGPLPSPCLPCPPNPCFPPPCRPCPPSPCRPCPPSPCRPCPPSSCRPCPPSPCRPCPPSPCRPCRPSPCRPCPPPSCRPCPPLPCKLPCTLLTCNSPCNTCCSSSPCLRPCPVGRRKSRRAKSLPKIRSHRKRISPCKNRAKTCPVVRCRSVPGPCIPACGYPPFCPPLSCPMPRCKSSCSTCCNE